MFVSGVHCLAEARQAGRSHCAEAQRTAWANVCSYRCWAGLAKTSYDSPLRVLRVLEGLYAYSYYRRGSGKKVREMLDAA